MMFGELITSASSYLDVITGGNQMIAGAISLWFMGVLTFIAKDLPRRIIEIIKKYLITSMTFNNGGWDEKEMFIHFMNWIKPNMKESLSRTISITPSFSNNDEIKATMGIGYGIHFFFFDGRLFWLNKTKIESSGSERQKEEIVISKFGRSHKPFEKMVYEFMPKHDDSKLNIYHLSMEGDWNKYSSIAKRNLDTIAAPCNLKDSIKAQIEHFKSNRDWFYKRGLPYKISYLVYGHPGGGKTSLIKAIASEFNMNICVININQVSDKSLEKGLSNTPKNSVVIIEDFDSSSASKDRVQTVADSNDDLSSMLQSLTLTGLLNALDGVNPLDDCVLFLTTNHLEKVDKAIYRKGRIDHLIEIKDVQPNDVLEYSKKLFPEFDFSAVEFNAVVGCHLNEALLYSKDDPHKYVESLRQCGGVK